MSDTLDVVTVDEVEAELGIDPDSQPLLPSYITSVSRMLDKACGPIVQRTITGEAHDGGDWHVSLNLFPVASVTTVTEYAHTVASVLTGETAATAPANGYLADLDSGVLLRRRAKVDWPWVSGRGNVVVTYVAGRYTSTLTVDDRFKRAAYITLANLWRREQGMGTVTFGADGMPMVGATYALPNAAKAFIQDDLRPSGLAD
jgi:hypothetical protein